MPITTGARVPAVSADQLEAAIQAYVEKRGKPSKYNPELAAEIIDRVENGESFTTIGKNKDMPAASTLFHWMNVIPDFGKRYETAKKIWTHVVNQEALQKLNETPDDAPMSMVKRNEAIAKHTLELTSRMNAPDYAPKQQIQMDVRSVSIKTTHEKLAAMMNE